MRSAVYDTESVEPLASEMGRFTFQTDVRQVSSSRTAKRPRGPAAAVVGK